MKSMAHAVCNWQQETAHEKLIVDRDVFAHNLVWLT